MKLALAFLRAKAARVNRGGCHVLGNGENGAGKSNCRQKDEQSRFTRDGSNQDSKEKVVEGGPMPMG